MIYRKVRTNLSRTLSAIEQDKATSDDYVKCILADPQIAAYIVQAVVEEFKDMEIDEIIPCMGEPTVTLRFPERLGVKVQNTGSESVDEEDGKIIYDIKFPVYYKGKKKEFIINIETQKSSKKQRTVEEQTYSDARGAVLKIRISGEKEDTGRRLWT